MPRALARLLLFVVVGWTGASPVRADVARPDHWKAVDRLVDEQKLQQALDRVEAIRRAARASGDDGELARALVKEVQLRIGLHGYETAVRFLRDEPWPRQPIPRLTLELFYAHSLVTYLRAYSWEIGQREKVESSGPIDLKAWTGEQIVAEAARAYQGAWRRRAELSRAPVSSLSEYLVPNTYPPQIRGTLRDALSYWIVEFLADTSNWTPEQSTQRRRIDAKALIAGKADGAAEAAIDDAALHPLIRIGAVLDDLQHWHAAERRREAALEARLERLRRLFAAFDREDERALIRNDLEKRLSAFRDLPWWSMGMAQLAGFWQEAGDLPRARSVALDGEKAYPGSPGGARCRGIVQTIEAPDFRIEAMQSDGIGRRSMAVVHKNIATVYFRAFAVDLPRRLDSGQGYEPNELQDRLKGTRPVAEWAGALPATPDYQTHQTFVTPPLERSGYYVVQASARKDFAATGNRIVAAGIIVGDLVLVSRSDGRDEEVIVLSGESGRPVAGAEVSLYRLDYPGYTRVDRKTSDGDGRVLFDARGGEHNRAYFVFARKGEDLALDGRGRWFHGRPPERETGAALVYTDRAVYRPLQTIHWKAIAYRGKTGRSSFRVAEGAPIAVTLVDANQQEVESRKLVTNGFGSVAGEFTVPAGRLLGAWQIRTSLGGATTVRVEEYKRPTFEVSLRDAEGAVRLNRPVTIAGDARYYFGLPVTRGAVQWRVTREPVYPLLWGFWRPVRPAATEVLAAGTAAVAANGAFHIRFTPEADERLSREKGGRDVSYRYLVGVDLTDEGGETRHAERTFRVGFASIEARIDSEKGFYLEGERAELTLARASLDGAPRPGAGHYRLFALAQPARAVPPADIPLPSVAESESRANAFHTPGDRLRPRWSTDYSPDAVMAAWPDGAEQAHGDLRHDDKGAAHLPLPALAPGAYRLRYQTEDEFGVRFETEKTFVVAGKQTPLALPALLLSREPSVKVGGTARFLALTGLPEQTLYFEIHRDDGSSERPLERRRLVGGGVIEVPVRDSDRGGFEVTLWLERDHQFVHLNAPLNVPWDDKELSLGFSTFRDRLRPGQKETWRVEVKGSSGAKVEAGAAEVLAYMYDRSLDLFAPPNAGPSPLALYRTRLALPAPWASLGNANVHWLVNDAWLTPPPPYPELVTDQLRFYDGYGIGGPGRRRFGGLEGAPSIRSRANGLRMPAAAPIPRAASRGVSDAVAQVEAIGIAGGAVPAAPPPASEPIRSQFAATAFFQPSLVTDGNGAVAIEFTVPDSVTAWNVWVHAITRDLRAGSINKEARSAKELMVRPYLPRFLREGDRAELKVVVNDASNKPMNGTVDLDVIDPETGQSVASRFGLAAHTQSFTVAAGGGATVRFALTAPKQVGTVAFKVVARAGDFSDGELRPLPVLPGRFHLAQSRFVTLRDRDRRQMKFADLESGGDPSRINESMVVTVDGQLFYTVLQALPYLVDYPYECTEQMLNRFVSTGIVASMYKDFPAIARMAESFSKRKSRLETFDAADPNRKMVLEESPWLEESRGGADPGAPLINVLDPAIARAQRDEALARLARAQTPDGGFPWFPGGPPSPYMTLYLMSGFARAAEFGVPVPKDVARRAWTYLARELRAQLAKSVKDGTGWEFVTFFNYVASSYPDSSYTGDAPAVEERKRMLDFSFAHWKRHSPYLKGMLALTLKRMGRPADAQLVFASVMDSAKTLPDQGTFWAPEDRSWLWYEDTIETQAFALRTLMELSPGDPRKDGLVLWLFLNKKLNHWKSTRATAEVIYSLIHYLKGEGALGVREEARVTVGPVEKQFVFAPDAYQGKSQLVIAGDRIDPRASSTVTVEKATRGYLFASATWHFSTERLPSEERGDFFRVSRRYFKRDGGGKEVVLRPLADGARVAPGDEIEVQIALRSKHAAEYVHLRDPRAAGFEPESATSRYRWDLGVSWYEEIRDSGANFFFESLPAGEYTFKYRVRANVAGVFRVAPATVQSMYAPEFNAYSTGAALTIGEAP